MDNHRCSSSKYIIGIPAILVAVALLVGPPVHAQQQPRLSAPYAKAALQALVAIGSDMSAPRDKTRETAEMSATQRQIDAADTEAMSAQEESITKMLRQIYRLRLRDNDLLMAYQKLTEIEGAENASDPLIIREKKAYAVSEFADNEAVIEKSEEGCFGQLEESLRHRSPESITACSDWIQKAKLSDEDPVKSATSDEGH